MPKLSIIIPVYNVDKYIRECLDSIINQTFTDFEVLMINDGSPDSSGAICDEYVEKDSRFRVFHKENGGVSSARNLGLDHATGEWITFMDPDDALISNRVYQEIFENIKSDIDMIRFSFIKGENLMKVNEEYKPMEKPFSFKILNENQFKGEIYSYGNVWNTIIKRKIIGNQRFENIHIGEDGLFVRIAMLKMSRIMIIDKAYYFYRYNQNSATRTYKSTDFNDRLFYTLKLREEYKKTSYYNEQRFNEYILLTFVQAIGFEMRNLTAKEAGERIKEFSPKFGIDKILTWKKATEEGVPVRIMLKLGTYKLLKKYIETRLK